MTRFDRRVLLGAAGAAALGGGIALDRLALQGGPDDRDVVPFHGRHQAGIATAAQDRLFFASFDVTTTSRNELRELLRTWTDAAARMTEGRTAGPRNDEYAAPPDDTGEALGLDP